MCEEQLKGQMDIYDFLMNPSYKIKKPVRLIELFAGVGSQAMALKRLNVNFEHYRVVEFDKYAIKSYNAIHGTEFPTMDITQIHGEDLGITDKINHCYIMTYSFPCQDLSLAGKGKGMEKGSDTRSGLLWEVERLLNESAELPQVLLMENVTQVHGKKNKEHFDKWVEFLESKGYSNYWHDMNSKEYGVPQNRDRCFMVSILHGRGYEFPEKVDLKSRIKDILESNVNESYYVTRGNIQYYIKKKGGKGIENFEAKQIKKVDEVSNTVRVGDHGSLDRHSWDLIAKPLILDDRDKGFGIKVSDICPTQRATRSGIKVIEYPHSIRRLTPKECWRLMDFSDEDFEKAAEVNSNTQLYKQAGNSIVVNCLVAIFGQLFEGKEEIYKDICKRQKISI